MKIEHAAFNVADPVAMGQWYVEHLGLTVKRRSLESPYAHFLADDGDAVMLEIYGSPAAPVPDYHNLSPAAFHLAFTSSDVASDVQRLQAAGALQIGQIDEAANGDQFAMLRDPWGLPIQLVRRGTPMI